MEKVEIIKKEAEMDIATSIEKRFIEKKDQNQITWDPTITGFLENLPNKLFETFENLSNTGSFPKPNNNEIRVFYMRIVDNHIEIGLANVEFIR